MESGSLSGADVAETMMEVVEKGEYPGGSVVTDNYYVRKQLEKSEDIEAIFAPLKETSYAPVRAIFNKERAVAQLN